MKKKFILLPITLIALAPTMSMVGCGKDKYIKVELTYLGGNLFCSEKINLIQGNKYVFTCSIGEEEGGDNFNFKNGPETGSDKLFVDVIVNSFTFNGNNVDYEAQIVEGVSWNLKCYSDLEKGNLEIKLSVNKTINDVYAWFTH